MPKSQQQLDSKRFGWWRCSCKTVNKAGAKRRKKCGAPMPTDYTVVRYG